MRGDSTYSVCLDLRGRGLLRLACLYSPYAVVLLDVDFLSDAPSVLYMVHWTSAHLPFCSFKVMIFLDFVFDFPDLWRRLQQQPQQRRQDYFL